MFGQIFARVRDEARRIWFYKWLVTAVTTAVAVGAVAFVVSLPNIYEAWGQLYISRQTPLSAAASSVSLDLGASNTYLVQKTLLNDDNLERVARALNPQRRFTKPELASAAAGLKRDIRLVDSSDGFVEVHYKNKDPDRAQTVVRLILTQFVSDSYERSQQDLWRASTFLDQQIAAYADLISRSQAEIAAVRGRSGLSLSTPGGDTEPVESSPTEDFVAEPVQPAAALTAKPSEAAQRVSQLEAKLASLETVDTDQHPDVVATRRELEAARAEESQAPVQFADAPHATFRSALRRRVHVRRQPAPAPQAIAKLAELTRRDELLRTSYQQLVSKRAATQMSEAVSGADRADKIVVTREPSKPLAPVGPNRPLYLTAGLLAALGAGLAAGYLRAVTIGIMVSPRELEEAIQLPVIGTISLERAWLTHPTNSATFRAADLPAPRHRRIRLEALLGTVR